jgi:hypothetical protein
MNTLLVEYSLYSETNIPKENIEFIKNEINEINKMFAGFAGYFYTYDLTAKFDTFFKKVHYDIEIRSVSFNIKHFHFIYRFDDKVNKYSISSEDEDILFPTFKACFMSFLTQLLEESEARSKYMQKIINLIP